MNVFVYDRTFEGLLTVVFEAYVRKAFPDLILGEEEMLPLFYDVKVEVQTDKGRADRVWKGLQRKLSPLGLGVLTTAWLSELPEMELLLVRYMRRALDAKGNVEWDFGNEDVLRATQLAKKVSQEAHRLNQFLRFQKAADGTYFAAVEPLYNVLPLSLRYLRDRFADQVWLVYDLKREYGYYYDKKEAREVRFEHPAAHLKTGKLDDSLMDKDERLFQEMWKAYFHAIAIKERANPRLHRQNLPVRFWKHLPEKS